MDENLVKLNNSIEKMMEEYPRRVVTGAINGAKRSWLK